ncbi:MAG: hypothetical protein FWF79_00585 [Defluviitaleaceae bacterium]|nr:hypothetical protein [Defluviitaleaceae bacterium]
MKKKIFATFATFAIILAMLIILPAVPASGAFDVFTGTLLAELDAGVNVPAWGFGDEMASVSFSINQESIIFMTFDEPIAFAGDAAIVTNIPVIGNADAESSGARVLSFIVDGNDYGARDVPLVSHENSGFLAFDLARTGEHDFYNLAGLEPFTRLEITFIVNNLPIGVEDPPEEEILAPAPIQETVDGTDDIPDETPTVDEASPAEDVSPADEDEEGDGFPGWVIGLLITALVAGLMVLVFRILTKKK